MSGFYQYSSAQDIIFEERFGGSAKLTFLVTTIPESNDFFLLVLESNLCSGFHLVVFARD
jgi:hypothetical protein